jgi:hypothetical protein
MRQPEICGLRFVGREYSGYWIPVKRILIVVVCAAFLVSDCGADDFIRPTIQNHRPHRPD